MNLDNRVNTAQRSEKISSMPLEPLLYNICIQRTMRKGCWAEEPIIYPGSELDSLPAVVSIHFGSLV